MAADVRTAALTSLLLLYPIPDQQRGLILESNKALSSRAVALWERIDMVVHERRACIGYPSWREGEEPRQGHLREQIMPRGIHLDFLTMARKMRSPTMKSWPPSAITAASFPLVSASAHGPPMPVASHGLEDYGSDLAIEDGRMRG